MLYDLTIPQFSKMLKNLNAVLDKAQVYADEKKFACEVLLETRLAPDMFPLGRQIQIACDTAKLCTARLTGKDAPVHEDNEKTLADFKSRINSVINFMGDFNEKDFVGSETKHISQPRWEGKYLTGTEYVLQHALPNLYFHITAAYAILRNNGVPVGKKDYLGEMPYKK